MDYNMIRKKFQTCLILFLCGVFLACFSLGTHFFGNIIMKQQVIEVYKFYVYSIYLKLKI